MNRNRGSKTRALRRALLVLLAGFCPSAVFGQYIYYVTNPASNWYTYPTWYGAAQGSIIALTGSGLGPYRMVQNRPIPSLLDLVKRATFPLPLQRDGASVKLTIAGSTQSLPILYTSSNLVLALLPSATPAGEGEVTASYRGKTGYPSYIRVVESAFGIFAQTGSGQGEGVITNADGQLRTLAESAKSGDSVSLWGTGLGAVTGNEANGPLPGTQFAGVEVYVGSARAEVSYAGRAECCAGLDQVTFQVPEGVQGCFVPVVVKSSGVTSNFVSMAVTPDGGPCSDPVGIPADLLRSAQAGRPMTIAAIAVGPVAILNNSGYSYSSEIAKNLSATLHMKVTENEVRKVLQANGSKRRKAVADLVNRSTSSPLRRAERLADLARMARKLDEMGAGAYFGQLSFAARLATQFGGVLPSPGFCAVYSDAMNDEDRWASKRTALDAGAELAISGPLGSRAMSRGSGGQYQTSFGGGFTAPRLPAGQYTVTGSGGSSVGPFTALLNVTADLLWTNKDVTTVVDRSVPLEITWSSSASEGFVLIGGSASSEDSRVFGCVEDIRKGRFTVPAHVLGALPTRQMGKGYIFLGTHPMQNRIQVAELDVAFIADLSSDGREVEVR